MWMERKKREAEADPEADPYYLTYPYVYTAPVVKPAVKTVEVKTPAVTYAYHHALPYTHGYHGLYPYSYGYHGYPLVVTKPVEAEAEAVEAERKTRDADADPAILASSTRVVTPVSPVTYAHLPYTLPYTTVAYTPTLDIPLPTMPTGWENKKNQILSFCIFKKLNQKCLFYFENHVTYEHHHLLPYFH